MRTDMIVPRESAPISSSAARTSFPLLALPRDKRKPLIENILWIILLFQDLQPGQTLTVDLLEAFITVREIDIRHITGYLAGGPPQITDLVARGLGYRIEGFVGVGGEEDGVEGDVAERERTACRGGEALGFDERVRFHQHGAIFRARVLGREGGELGEDRAPGGRVHVFHPRCVRRFAAAFDAEARGAVVPVGLGPDGRRVGQVVDVEDGFEFTTTRDFVAVVEYRDEEGRVAVADGVIHEYVHFGFQLEGVDRAYYLFDLRWVEDDGAQPGGVLALWDWGRLHYRGCDDAEVGACAPQSPP